MKSLPACLVGCDWGEALPRERFDWFAAAFSYPRGCLTVNIIVRSCHGRGGGNQYSKGQITIPAEIRRLMNLNPQDRVVFTVLPNGTTIMRAKNRSIASLAKLVKLPKKKVAIDEMKMD